MSSGVLSTQNMAFSSSNQSRSFTNLSKATEEKRSTNGSALSTAFGGSGNPWSGNIWGSGSMSNPLRSKATTRDSSISRDATRQAFVPAEIEGKTGSGSLVDSSVSDDWTYRPSYKPSELSASSMSQLRYSSTTASQQRSTSNAGLTPSFADGAAQYSQQSYSYRPPTVNLNATSSSNGRPAFNSGLSTTHSSRTSEQPPPVYTKFDRPIENGMQRKGPDSALGSWADAGLQSPSEERRPGVGADYFKTPSMPSSRNGSLTPSRNGDDQPTFHIKTDFTRTHYGVNGTSRATSMSSQHNGSHASRFASPVDQVLPHIGQLSLENDSSRLQNPATFMNGYSSQASGFQSTSSFARPPPHCLTNGAQGDDVEEVDRLGAGFLGLDGYQSTTYSNGFPEFRPVSFTDRSFTSPAALDYRQNAYYASGDFSPRGLDQNLALRSPTDYQAVQGGQPLYTNKRLQGVQDQQTWIDPRLQQMMAAQLRSQYGLPYPYGIPNGLQLHGMSPYMPLSVLPNGFPGIDTSTGPRDAYIGDGVQSALMYEFKSNNKTSKRYELKDIYDHIAEFSGDQHGSRFIQQKLETANSDEKERVFREIQPNAIPLMTDVFGNYVIQKFFEHGDQAQKKILANKMRGQVLNLSLQMYGCRVVQKALEHILVDQQAILIREVENYVLKCVKDQNGNHVIQKAIERCPPSTIGFIIAAFQGQVQHLSIHPYGCRVIQRCLEHCDAPSKQLIMAELHDGMPGMIADQYANYVVQHVVEHGGEEDRRRVLALVGRGLEGYSKHKFASNVVEKCLSCAGDQWRRDVVTVLADGSRRVDGEGVLVGMIKDNYGNYVIQKLLDVLAPQDYQYFHSVLQPEMMKAKRTGGGKQLLSIERKMHRFDYLGNGHYLPLPTPPFASLCVSAATTPPPLMSDTQSLQSSTIPSVNGDAVEGAASSRKGSEPCSDGGHAARVFQ